MPVGGPWPSPATPGHGETPGADAGQAHTAVPVVDGAPASGVTPASSAAPAIDAPADPDATIAVLEALARGEIDVAEAERRLGASASGKNGRG